MSCTFWLLEEQFGLVFFYSLFSKSLWFSTGDFTGKKNVYMAVKLRNLSGVIIEGLGLIYFLACSVFTTLSMLGD